MAYPREFFDTFVMPAVSDWQNDPDNERLATMAICQLDILVEHIINHLNPNTSRPDVTVERDRLAISFPELSILRDVHDTHKHGHLTRRSAKITKGQRLEIYSFGGGFGSMPFGSAPFGGTLDELAIELDDGKRFSVPVTISGCLAYWRNEMSRLGI